MGFRANSVDKDKEHEIVGNYTGDLWGNGVKKNFDEIKAGKDPSFLLLEHTDGHNYAYIEGLGNLSLLNTNRFGIDGVIGAGAGLLIPKTRTRIAEQEYTAAFSDIDNKFKVAGWGVHADLSFVFKYIFKSGVSPFVKTTGRVLYSKIKNALYYKEEGKVSQSMFRTLMPTLSVGVEVPLNTVVNTKDRRKLKKELRILEKMKKIDEKNDRDELSLEELDKLMKEEAKKS